MPLALVEPEQGAMRRRQTALSPCSPLVKVEFTELRNSPVVLRRVRQRTFFEAGPVANESSFFPRRPLRARKLLRFIRKTKPFSRFPEIILSRRSKAANQG